MMRFYRYLLIHFNIILFFPLILYATQAITPKQYLDAIGSYPKSSSVYAFLDIFKDEFMVCEDMSTYLNALELLLKNGDTGEVSTRIDNLDVCTLNQEQEQHVLKLKDKINSINQKKIAVEKPLFLLEVSQNTVIDNVSDKNISKTVNPVTNILITADNTLNSKNNLTQDKPTPVAADNFISKSTIIAAKVRNVTVNEKVNDAAKKEAIEEKQPPIYLLSDNETLVHEVNISEQKMENSKYASSINTYSSWKSGDAGTGRLFRFGSIVSLEFEPYILKAEIFYLNSGKYNGMPAVGSENTDSIFVDNDKLLTSIVLFEPKFLYTGNKFTFTLGSTPIGGNIDPVPTARLQFIVDNISLVIFHDSVQDSILSTVGFKDLYSNKLMGRVVKAGVEAEYKHSSNDWFHGEIVTLAYLYGANVKENSHAKVEGYFGKALNNFSTGMYASLEHYETDLNHYTFGHGGYYSPQMLGVSSLFASYRKLFDTVKYEIDTSVGIAYEKNNDSKIYYGIPNNGNYIGKDGIQFPITGKIKITKLLSPNADISFEGKILNSGSYTEGKLSLNINYVF